MKKVYPIVLLLAFFIVGTNSMAIAANEKVRLKLASSLYSPAISFFSEGDYAEAIKNFSKGYRISRKEERFRDRIIETQKEIIRADYLEEGNQLLEAKKLYDSQKVMPHRVKVAYLTFDDGPSINTQKILEILDRYQVKATFFVTGNASDFARNMYSRIVNGGHALGNHTYSHLYAMIYVSVEAFKEDFYHLEDLLYETAGIRPKIMRFPGGSKNLISRQKGGKELMNRLIAEMGALGYQYFDWNVDCGDSRKVLEDKDTIIDSVLKGGQDKDKLIVLMHDTKVKITTPEALPSIIEGLREQGFIFDTLR